MDSQRTPYEIETEALLTDLAQNKVRQLCKSIMYLCFESILAVIVVRTSVREEVEQRKLKHPNYFTVLVNSATGLAVAWSLIIFLGLFTEMCSSKKRKYFSTKEVESIFSRSYEIPYSEPKFAMELIRKFTSKAIILRIPLMNFAKCLWLGNFFTFCFLFGLFAGMDLSFATGVSLLQLALQLYRIVADVTEYLARTHLDEDLLQRHGRQLAHMEQEMASPEVDETLGIAAIGLGAV